MGKRIGRMCIALGGVCLLAALGLFLYNDMENSRAERMTQEILPELQTAIETQAEPQTSEVPGEEAAASETLFIDGREYIGYLSIPALELNLPVQSDWSYPKLKVSPCRYTGSAAGGDLVIAAHNYKRHFARLYTLLPGDDVSFTDAAGKVFQYQVERVETLTPTAVEEMVSGDWDLTLFTCTYGGKSRVTVRCKAVTDEKTARNGS